MCVIRWFHMQVSLKGVGSNKMKTTFVAGFLGASSELVHSVSHQEWTGTKKGVVFPPEPALGT